MFAPRRERVDEEVRERFVRVIGLPEVDDGSPPVDPPRRAGQNLDRTGYGSSRADHDLSRADHDLSRADHDLSRADHDLSRADRDLGRAGRDFGRAAGRGEAGGRGAAALGAFDPGRRGVRALAVVALLAVAGAAFFAWRSRPQPSPVPAVRAEPSAAATASPGQVVVAVSGRVHRPGLVRLPAGSRVADAIDAAGGALPDTDLAHVNLARKLVDGELVAVGIAAPAGAAPGGAPGAGGGLLNINTATATEFEALPGIGPVLAKHIVDHRTRHGPFRAVTDLRQVEGLGAGRFNQIKDLVTV